MARASQKEKLQNIPISRPGNFEHQQIFFSAACFRALQLTETPISLKIAENPLMTGRMSLLFYGVSFHQTT